MAWAIWWSSHCKLECKNTWTQYIHSKNVLVQTVQFVLQLLNRIRIPRWNSRLVTEHVCLIWHAVKICKVTCGWSSEWKLYVNESFSERPCLNGFRLKILDTRAITTTKDFFNKKKTAFSFWFRVRVLVELLGHVCTSCAIPWPWSDPVSSEFDWFNTFARFNSSPSLYGAARVVVKLAE